MVQAQGGGGGGGTQGHITAPRRTKPLSVGPSGITVVGNASPKPVTARPFSGVSSGGSSMVSSGGGGGGGGGARMGSGVGSTSGGTVSATPPPAPPSLAQFLRGDSAYNSQTSALEKAKADYLAQQNLSKNSYLTNYAGDLDSLGQSREEAYQGLTNDFAARGLLQSGLYANNQADLAKDFDSKQSNLEKARAQFLAQMAADMTNFQGEQTITGNKAKQDAAARYAARYGG